MGKIKTLFWDWNGTLLDDVDLCLRIINSMLKKRNVQEFASLEDYRRTFCFPVAGFDFEQESFAALAVEYMALYQPASFQCALRGGVQPVLERLWREGISQIVLSASERGNLLAQAGRYEIFPLFEQWLGIDDVFAKSKRHVGMHWIETQRMNPEEVLLIGDTVHDYEVARAMGCQALLLTGGHQDRSRLEGCGCPVVERVEEIFDYLF